MVTTKTNDIDMGQLLLEILESDSAFGKDMRKRVSSSFNLIANKIDKGVSNIKFSKEPITVMDLSGMDEKSKDTMAKKFETQQKTIYNWLTDVSKAANWENVRGKGNNTISIADFFQTSKSKQSTYKKDFEANQKKIIDAMKKNIPTKVDIIEHMTKSGTIKVPDAPKESTKKDSKDKKLLFADARLDSGMTPPLPLENKGKTLIEQTLEKANKVVRKDQSEDFKEGEPQPVIISSISKEAHKQFSDIFNKIRDFKSSDGKNADGKNANGGGILSSLIGGGSAGILGGKMLMGSNGKSLIGRMFAALIPKGAPKGLAVLGPIAMILGSVVWMAIDAFKGWMASGDWGTSKTAGAIGGILGGMDSGFKGAMKNMGKWALLGAGIGSVVPVVGTLIGGLIGAALGGILGWIGGENIAKAMDKVGEWFTEQYEKGLSIVNDFLEGDAETKWQMYKTALVGPYVWLGKKALEITEWVDNTLEKTFGEKWTNFKASFGKMFTWLDDKIEDILWWIDDKLYGIFGQSWEGFKDTIQELGDMIYDTFIKPVENFFIEGKFDDWGVILMKFLSEDIPAWIRGKIKEAKDTIMGGWNVTKELGQKALEKTTTYFRGDKQQRINDLKYEIMHEKEVGGNIRGIENKQKRLDKLLAEENSIEKQQEKVSVASGSSNDFIYRPGQPIQKFTGSDVVIGAKEKIVIENKGLDDNMNKLYNTMNDIKDQFNVLLNINTEMLKMGNNVKTPRVPLPDIPTSINTNKELAYEAADKHKYMGWRYMYS